MIAAEKSRLDLFLKRSQSETGEVEVWGKPSYRPPIIEFNNVDIHFKTCLPDLVLAVKADEKQNNLLGIVVNENGQLHVEELKSDDRRVRLFIIDLKLSQSVEPNHSEAGHYAYTMAHFLKEQGYDNRYVICAAGILPISNDGIFRNLSLGIEDICNVFLSKVNWIDLSLWMNRLNDFMFSILPRVFKLTHETAEWQIEKNKCNGCEYFQETNGLPNASCHQEAIQQNRLELLPEIPESLVSELKRKNIKNLKEVSLLNLGNLGSQEDLLYRAVCAFGFNRIKELAKGITSRIESGSRPVYKRFRNYKSVAIPIEEKTLQEYVIGVEFDSSSHKLAAIGAKQVGKEGLVFYDEIHFMKDQVLPTSDQEIELIKNFSDFIKEIKKQSEKIHVYFWSQRELTFTRELLERYNDYINDDIAELASLFIAPSHFRPPHYIQSEFVQRSNLVVSPVTILDKEVKRAFCLPTFYTFSIFEIGEYFDISYKKFQNENYADFVTILTDAVPAIGIHKFWKETVEEKTSFSESKLRTLMLHKLDVLNKCLKEMRLSFKMAFSREAFQADQLNYSYQYPASLAKEAHAWLLQAALNQCMDAYNVLKIWELPYVERTAKGKSAHLKLIPSEEWKKIYDESPKKFEKSKFKRIYEEGTFVFKVSGISKELDIKEGERWENWCLALEGEALNLLAINPPGIKTFHSASKHPFNGFEYLYDLLSCQVEQYRDGYAVLNIWSKNNPRLRKGYSKGKWDERKKEFWKKEKIRFHEPEYFFTLESKPFDTLVNRLEEALPLLFPGTVDFEELQKQLVTKLNKLKNQIERSREKRALKECCDYLEEDLPLVKSPISAEQVRYFKETFEQFLKTQNELKFRLSEDEKNLVIAVEETARRISLYSTFLSNTPVGTEQGVSNIHTYCAQYMLSPPKIEYKDQLIDEGKITKEVDVLRKKKADGLTISQADAIESFFLNYLSILLGPPGSGKSYTLRKFLELWQKLYPDQKALISASNNSVVDELYSDLPNEIKSKTKRIDNVYDMRSSEYDCYQIFATTPQMVWKLYSEKRTGWKLDTHCFDLVVIDEAAQMPPAQAVLVMSAIRQGARIIFAGDDLQLPPIHQYVHPDGLEHYVSSIYSYFKNVFDIKPFMLKESFRSHPDIVNFLSKIGYPQFTPKRTREESALSFKRDASVFRENYTESAITVVVDNDKTSDKVNTKQADETIKIVSELWEARLKNGKDEEYDFISFFEKGVAVITPFRMQDIQIQNKLLEWARELYNNRGQLFTEEIQAAIRNAVDTVHSFQGKERDVVIVTLPTGLKESCNDNHLLNPHLLNVAISRAKKKVIVFCTLNALNFSKAADEDKPSLFKNPYILRELVEYCNESNRGINISEDRTIYHYTEVDE